jgi:hypothetical protein
MSKTVVGLFKNPSQVDDVVTEIEALGLARQDVRTLAEPSTFEVIGVMSFARLDFEVDPSGFRSGVMRELSRIGATKADAQAYVDGLRRGGALEMATSSDGSRGYDSDAR